MLFMHTAAVQTFLGAGPTGDTYGPTTTVAGFLDDGVVRQQTSQGEQLVSRTMFYTDLANAALFTPQSRVTVNGRAAQVTTIRRRDGGSLLAPVSHVEVDLT
jgi:hypothetical protein